MVHKTLIAIAMIVSLRTAADEPLPADLPLPASPPITSKWLSEANLLQPYGHSQFIDITQAADRSQQMRKEFGFNAIVVQPTDSHNVTAGPADQLTDEQFRAGIATYRKAGWKVILYTSLTGFGGTKEFQSGQIGREHPEWSQRDPKGNPIMVYGAPWLCPSTGARQAALDRAVKLTRDYQPDGVLLDNNQFYFTDAGWTCHCDACTKAFRQYVGQRFGVEKSRALFGAPPQELLIPVQEGPLYALWMKWRNRVWAEVNEEYRAKLREANPNVIFFGNTQYLFRDGSLATDDQYEREDIVVSESVGLDAGGMARKMMLGHALAAGRPLWNYIGTFTESNSYTGMRPAAVVGPLIAATIAHGARPWIVDGFDEGAKDAAARKEMSRLLGWHARHEELFHGDKWAGVGSVVSLTSHDVLHRPLFPPHWKALQAAGTPLIALRDDELTAPSLRPFHFITIETAACLSDDAAAVLAKWVREGGTLIAATDVGAFDELGRKRSTPSLWRALKMDVPPEQDTTVGKGKVIVAPATKFSAAAVQASRPMSFQLAADSGAQVVAYHDGTTLLLHVLMSGKPVKLSLPVSLGNAAAGAQVFIPGRDDTSSIPIEDGSHLSLSLAEPYVVLKIPLR